MSHSTNFPTLLEWLYVSNPKSSGSLILYPRMLNRWNVSSLIVTNWECYNVFIVTDYPTEFMQSVTDTPSFHWTDLDLIPYSLVKYSDISHINHLLHNTEVDIILFDDARMLATISSALDFTSIHPKIIVLTTWGDTYNHLDIITSHLPNLHLLTLDLISDPIDITWNLITVPLSSRQLSFYNLIRQQELSSPSIIPFPRTRSVTLYTYPDNISNNLQNKPICELSPQIPDNSWLTSTHLSTLYNDGPKLESLIDGVISHWPSKQIIFTRFNHLYGVDLISSFLQLSIQEKKNPYDSFQLFHISCTDDYDSIINTLHKFNSTDSSILITNIIPFIPLKYISIIHIVDTFSFLSIKMLIDRCHKRSLSHNYNDLIIYSYVATHPTEPSSDLSLYNLLVQNIHDSNHLYSGLISCSHRIIFKPSIGIVVLCQ